jgi:Cof subfamily protein (haloacid dehalogenase superfamily)
MQIKMIAAADTSKRYIKIFPKMNIPIPASPRIFAFDLDGTLLTSDKTITPETVIALKEMQHEGSHIVFASGRMAESISRYLHFFDFPISVLACNGAEVYLDYSEKRQKIHSAPLTPEVTDTLLDFEQRDAITLNYYLDGKLYARNNEMNQPWIQLYREQTNSVYSMIDSFDELRGTTPSKIIFVSSPEKLDALQEKFSAVFGDSVYICRTWDYYLEFLNPSTNKGIGLEKIAQSFNFSLDKVIAFGDAENDIPMLSSAGYSIAPRNASSEVKAAATYASPFDNNENVIAREWERIKNNYPI